LLLCRHCQLADTCGRKSRVAYSSRAGRFAKSPNSSSLCRCRGESQCRRYLESRNEDEASNREVCQDHRDWLGSARVGYSNQTNVAFHSCNDRVKAAGQHLFGVRAHLPQYVCDFYRHRMSPFPSSDGIPILSSRFALDPHLFCEGNQLSTFREPDAWPLFLLKKRRLSGRHNPVLANRRRHVCNSAS
jgi:hypothetical protein